ncbi:hypothetical protein J6590_031498 [Homalodisca vitripennis]|nr:hypothetical protein J6590_031498 [Homalodisca vitripennis]
MPRTTSEWFTATRSEDKEGAAAGRLRTHKTVAVVVLVGHQERIDGRGDGRSLPQSQAQFPHLVNLVGTVVSALCLSVTSVIRASQPHPSLARPSFVTQPGPLSLPQSQAQFPHLVNLVGTVVSALFLSMTSVIRASQPYPSLARLSFVTQLGPSLHSQSQAQFPHVTDD